MQRKFQYMMLGGGLTLLLLIGLLVVILLPAKANESITNTETANELANYTDTNPQIDATVDEIQQRQEANSAILAKRQRLVDRWHDTVTTQSGWLHTIVQYNRDVEEAGTLPNGTTIPGDYIAETWYHLSKNGTVTELVNIMWDLDRNLVQFSTYRDNLWRDFAMSEVWTGNPPHLPTDQRLESEPFDFDLITLEDSNKDGRDVLVFTAYSVHSPIALDDMEGTSVGGSLVRESLDAKTGQPLLVETIFLVADGTEYISSQYEYLLVENVSELPSHVADLLNQDIDNPEVID
jgi:hypothetical protein